jgi:diacylglycerol O-acyltransferase
MDQGSFVGWRALGRQPVLHFSWTYQHSLDEAAVLRLNQSISQGFLGRVIQRSPLPWGRHRWVAPATIPPVTWFRDPIPLEHLPKWRSSMVSLPVDPEQGPGWRMAVQLLEGGGWALSILISHTIGDAEACSTAIADAAAGRKFRHQFPAPSWRWSPARLASDSLESLKTLPDVLKAITALVRRSRAKGAVLAPPANQPQKISQLGPMPEVVMPLLKVVIHEPECEARAADLGVTVNVILAAFAARIAFRMGRVDVAGRVQLVLPVSNRQPDDLRGNALQSISVMADPESCHSTPRTLQSAVQAALLALRRHGDPISPLLPLVPYVPIWLARRSERMILSADLSVGCSLVGKLPEEFANLCGEAIHFELYTLERFSVSEIERLGGRLFLVSYRLNGQVLVSIEGYATGSVTDLDALKIRVSAAMADLGLEGAVC